MTSTSTRGVLTLAFGGVEYAQLAVTMARAIRLCDAETPLAVVTDLHARHFEGWFQHIVPWQYAYPSFYECKFDLYLMSPFDATLFMDSDCLALQPIRRVLDLFEGQEVSVAGHNVPMPWWFRDPERIRAWLPRETYPGFNGGMLYFRKSAAAERVFARAREWVAEYDALGVPRLDSGAINDEPMFSLAMAEQGCRALENTAHRIMYGPRRGRVEIDVLGGSCELEVRGDRVRPMVCHFEGADKDRYEYAREAQRLRVAGRAGRISPVAAALSDGAARLIWLRDAVRRRWTRLRRRLMRLREGRSI